MSGAVRRSGRSTAGKSPSRLGLGGDGWGVGPDRGYTSKDDHGGSVVGATETEVAQSSATNGAAAVSDGDGASRVRGPSALALLVGASLCFSLCTVSCYRVAQSGSMPECAGGCHGSGACRAVGVVQSLHHEWHCEWPYTRMAR